MHPIQLLLIALAAYAALGLVFAGAFIARGVTAIDHNARTGAPLGFRLLILPGSAALWPLLLRHWLRARRAGASAQTPAQTGDAAPQQAVHP